MRSVAVAVALLAAGCIGVVDDGAPPTPVTQATTATQPALPGLVVEATLSTVGTAHRIDAVASNRGPNTYNISSICQPPWSDRVEGANGGVVWPPPQVYCAAYGRKPFQPGETSSFRAWWNETIYKDEQASPAPPGDYDWTVAFHAGPHGASGPEHAVEATFRIRVR